MHLEIELEFENAIPIRTNLERVEHGDLLITDMYMPGTDILRMLRGVGLDKQVTIFRSNRGKSSGEGLAHSCLAHARSPRRRQYPFRL
jgi:hypothetical protein